MKLQVRRKRDICYAIRRQVFVEEQKLFDGDDRDEHDEQAIHYAALLHDEIIGTVRIYRDPEGIWWGGRLAVLKRYRGRAGRLLIQACVDRVRSEGAAHFRAFVQQENIAFFKTLNWIAIGAHDPDLQPAASVDGGGSVTGNQEN